MRSIVRACAFAVLVLLLISRAATSAENGDFFLRDGQRVVFFGDSITQGGTYVQLIDLYLTTRFPERVIEVINHGISSETVSGTSELDHTPRRPDAHKRFARDIAAWKPDVLVACFGMNDGNYHPFEPERYAAYQAGVQRLLKRAQDEAGGPRVVLLTPPPYDPYRRKAADPEAKYFGYKFPAIEYDHTLAKYAAYVTTLQSEQRLVVDLHTAINNHLTERRKSLVSYSVSPDAIHPNITGHWLMAQQVLLAWNAPAEVDRAVIDAVAVKASAGQIADLRNDEGTLRFRWTTRLPLHFDEQIDRGALSLEQSHERLNRLTLQVAGLAEGEYQLRAGATVLATVSASTLAQGVDLAQFDTLPTRAQAKKVWEMVRDRHKDQYSTWRKRIAKHESPLGDEAQRLRPDADASWQAVRDAAQPVVLDVRVTSAKR